MKTLIFLFVVTLFGCSKDCPECYNFAEPFRLAILNAQDENLLDPNNVNGLTIDKLTLASNSNNTPFSGNNLLFVIKDYIVPSEPSGFWHLESIDQKYTNNCIDKECEFYVTYKNSMTIDTLNVLIEKVTTEDSDGCKCIGYPLRYIKHNRVIITEYDLENRTGSAIIRK